jgi:serine/threonine protein kinase
VTKFWNATAELMGEGEGASSKSNSRYLTDFEELSLLGEGGFGHVVLCKNKLDGRRYAMKKILLKDKTLSQNNKILRLRHHLYSMLAVNGIEECVNISEANDVCRAIQSPIVFNCV